MSAPVTSVRDEFALRVIPAADRTAAFSIGMMLLAANLSLPVLVMGGQLGVAAGFVGAVRASCWGGLMLAALAGTCAYAGVRSRLSTYLLIVRAFGDRGGELISLVLACCAIGWFGVVAMLFADTMVRFASGSLFGWAVVGTLLMAGTTVVGFGALTRLSNIMLPAKLVLLAWAIWAAVRHHGSNLMGPPPAPALLDEGGAISFVVGGWVVGAVIAPDFARYSRTVAGGTIACALALGVGYPLVLVASSVPAILTGNSDLLDTMVRLQMGFAALAIVLLASWTNGALNLYSGSLMLAVVFRRRRRALLIWAAAVLGTALGVAGIAQRLIPYLTMLSLVVPPVAGVYLPRFLLDERSGAPLAPRRWDAAAFAALATGVVAAGVSRESRLALTGITAVDSLIVTASVYLLLEVVRVRRPTRRGAVVREGAARPPPP